MAENKVQNAKDGSAEGLGRTIDTQGNTSPYQSYEGTLTTDTAFDPYTDLGRYASAGYITNDDAAADSFGVKFSIDGTNYGEEITINAGEVFEINTWITFKKIQLLHTSDAPYRMVVR